MKKYSLLLILLIAIGGALVYFVNQQNTQLDENVYIETTDSIRNLKILDNALTLSLYKIRYQNISEYTTMEELSVSLSEEFDNLRFEALFEEIEQSSLLNKTTIDFEKALLEKQENISSFIDHHQKLRDASQRIVEYEQDDSALFAAIDKLSINEWIANINIDFYRFLQNSNEDNKQRLNNNIGKVDQAISSLNEDEKSIVYDYILSLSEVILETEETHKYFVQAISQPTTINLGSLESAYVEFHNKGIQASKTLKSYLIIYGVILLIVILLFAYQLRKQYLGLEQEVADRTSDIKKAYVKLQESQEQLIQSEKMASLGEMVAGVAHEINTPLGYVNSNVSTIQLNLTDIGEILTNIETIYKEARKPEKNNQRVAALLSKTLKAYKEIQADEIFDESQQLLDDSNHGLSEISKLVISLKDFARLDRQATDEVDIHTCIENSIKIATGPIKDNKVSVNRKFGELPNIVCMPSKLNQLFLNIITNAAYAMKEKGGELSINTKFMEDSIAVIFKDEGVGMDEETVQKMFDPFFTSKPIGEGTGLGMSIAYKIVQAHNGKIHVNSAPEKGTTIAVELPITQAQAA